MALALGVLSSGTGCHAQAPVKADAKPVLPKADAKPVPLCPATMQGAGGLKFRLTGLSIMRYDESTGWKNVQPAGSARKVWTLTPANGLQYRAVCEYDDEIIGVPIDAEFHRCWLAHHELGFVITWCER